ncbi:hypothetical protein [cf. Phormidesmis sp. LEGE 11477]|uniref:hypothetical protein n=1 Tax=cf. Phormidesmis sp. LEGE 11477 TaxID=1828680 RepID=UPI0018828AC6|nr:hypothetical protein [cf. Phormidesmis sp. LEGE 11477]MBE9062945.1 hypothetical protein [cf. Phormidesmis sp. LEGE 11477]
MLFAHSLKLVALLFSQDGTDFSFGGCADTTDLVGLAILAQSLGLSARSELISGKSNLGKAP